MFIGIDEDTNKIYESRNRHGVTPLEPSPFIFNVRFGNTAEEAIANLSVHTPHDYKFREDLYDPVSRIKRGRIYHGNGYLSWFRFPAAPREALQARDGHIEMRLQSFGRARIGAQYQFAAVGVEDSHTVWRIVAAEQIVNEEELLTLQPILFLGTLPDVEKSLIPSDLRKPLMEALDGVVADMKRAMPGSVIDRCRGAAALALQSLEGCKGKDLGKQANYVETKHKRFVVASCAKIINNLHTRAKENECHDKQYRSPNERDAELAVHCLACILTELELAK